jgi:hypothetical protein
MRRTEIGRGDVNVYLARRSGGKNSADKLCPKMRGESGGTASVPVSGGALHKTPLSHTAPGFLLT